MHAALDCGKPFDLISLDLTMPHMDGRTALEEMRNIETELGIPAVHQVKIVMTTASAGKEKGVKPIQARCDGCLAKPIQKVRILEEVHRLKLM
jgi:two-component system, chemotaxis family, chemotaxis protein CheY